MDAATTGETATRMQDEESPTCWLCLGEASEAHPLTRPCKCPSLWSHPICLGRWQLQSAGKDEERACRFCKEKLPGWTESLLDPSTAQNQSAVPIMAVVFNGRMVKLPCIPGKEGAELFKKQIREIFHLDESVSLDVTFELKVPTLADEQKADQKVYLRGFHTFEAASTVAAICAAKRMARKNTQSLPGNAGLSGAPKAASGTPATATETGTCTGNEACGSSGSTVPPAQPLDFSTLQRYNSASPTSIRGPLDCMQQGPSPHSDLIPALPSPMPAPDMGSSRAYSRISSPHPPAVPMAPYALASASTPGPDEGRRSCTRLHRPSNHAASTALPPLDILTLANNSSLSDPDTSSFHTANPTYALAAAPDTALQQQQAQRVQQQGAPTPRKKSISKRIVQKLRWFFGLVSSSSSSSKGSNSSSSKSHSAALRSATTTF